MYKVTHTNEAVKQKNPAGMAGLKYNKAAIIPAMQQ